MSNNEWYTPSRYVEAAREVMGSIDLDPASCALANKTVQATKYFTIEDNGLEQEWYGHVWLNPPYGKTGGKSNLAAFTSKLLAAYHDNHIKEAIMLLPTNTATSWFSPLWQFPICMPARRIRFNYSDGTLSTGASFSTCFVYVGPYKWCFQNVFAQFGTIVKAI